MSEMVYTDQSSPLVSPLDVHKAMSRRDVEMHDNKMEVAGPSLGMESSQILDFGQWLPAASPHYQISSNPEDYIVIPVPIIPSELPNRNGVSFPLSELLAFLPEYGCQSFKTFKGKPTHTEHRNGDIREAKGAVIDMAMRPMKGYNNGKIYKVLSLLGFDRSKDPELADMILRHELNSYSMGAMVLDGYSCSVCGNEPGRCRHIPSMNNAAFYTTSDNQLVYKRAHGICGIEISSVADPAWRPAISDTVLNED